MRFFIYISNNLCLLAKNGQGEYITDSLRQWHLSFIAMRLQCPTSNRYFMAILLLELSLKIFIRSLERLSMFQVFALRLKQAERSHPYHHHPYLLTEIRPLQHLCNQQAESSKVISYNLKTQR